VYVVQVGAGSRDRPRHGSGLARRALAPGQVRT